MPLSDYPTLMRDLKNRIFRPVYLLMGDEPFYIDKVSDFIIQHVLTEEEKAFNQAILYGTQADDGMVVGNARRYPMMASHQVVVVREAQALKSWDKLEKYLENPVQSTILVICHRNGSLDKRKKVYKAFLEKGMILETKKLYENQIPAWIGDNLKERGFGIEPAAGQLLTEFLGTDLIHISNELEKLCVALAGQKQVIEVADVERLCGFSREFNNFELQNAIGSRDWKRTFRIVHYFSENQKDNPLPVTIISLFRFFTQIIHIHQFKDKSKQGIAAALRINPYFVDPLLLAARNFNLAQSVQAISLLREFDLRSKGVDDSGTESGELLREMVVKIMGPGPLQL